MSQNSTSHYHLQPLQQPSSLAHHGSSQLDCLDLQSQVQDLQLRLRECRLKHKQEKDQLRIRFDLQQIRLEKDLHLKTQHKINQFRTEVRQQVEDVLKDIKNVKVEDNQAPINQELQNIQQKLQQLSTNLKIKEDDAEFLMFQDFNQDTQVMGSVFDGNDDEEGQALLNELQNINNRVHSRKLQQRKTSEPQGRSQKLQNDTLNLSNYSDLRKKIPMPQSKESLQVASESASVNQAMILSEQSFPQILSSASQSRQELRPRSKFSQQEILKQQLQEQINQLDRRMSLSEKERLLCQIYSKKLLDRAGLQDVRAEDVLQTFNNSIEPSKRSAALQNVLAEELGNLSPIRDKNNPKVDMRQIKQIAKEIKRIPTQDFKTEEFLKSEQNRSFEEEDSLLQELGKLSSKVSKEKILNPYQVNNRMRPTEQVTPNDIEELELRDYIDVPISKAISSIDSFKQPHQSSKQEIMARASLQDSKKGQYVRPGMRDSFLNKKILSQSQLEDSNRQINLNNNSSEQFIDLKSPFQRQSHSMLAGNNISDSEVAFINNQVNFQDNQQQTNNQNKLNIKKNQIRFNNLSNLVSHQRRQHDINKLVSQQNQPYVQSNNAPQVNNNFIELNNSVIILQKNSRESSPLASQNLGIDRPFSEMRKIKSKQTSQQFTQGGDYYSNRKINTQQQYQIKYQQQQLAQQNNLQSYLANYHFMDDQSQIKHFQSIKQQLGNSGLQRRFQNISVQETSYNQHQNNQMNLFSPNNQHFNTSQKRAQSSLNGSRVFNDLNAGSPYIQSKSKAQVQQQQQQSPSQQPTKQSFKMLKVGKKGNTATKLLNVSNPNLERHQSPSQNLPSAQQQQQQSIRVIKKNALNKILNTNSNGQTNHPKLKIQEMGPQVVSKFNFLAKASNKINRIQPS